MSLSLDDALSRSLESCNWKSALFYSQQMLLINCDCVNAVLVRLLAFFSARKYTEIEQFIQTLPPNLLNNEYVTIIRCRALEKMKDFGKIITVLGSDEVQLSALKSIRENALYNMEQTDERSVLCNERATKDRDALSPSKLSARIGQAMMSRDISFIEDISQLTDNTTSEDPYIITACGCNYRLHGQEESGRSFFMKAVEIDPTCEIAWLCLLQSFIETRSWDQGLSTIRKVVRLFPDSEEVCMFAISLHLKSGSVSLAWTWISKSDVDILFVRHERGVASLMENDCSEAAKDFESVLSEAKEEDLIASAALNLGHCMRRLGNLEKAIALYQKALAFETVCAEALASIGFTHHLQGDFDNAMLFYTECLSVDACHPFATKMMDLAFKNMM